MVRVRGFAASHRALLYLDPKCLYHCLARVPALCRVLCAIAACHIVASHCAVWPRSVRPFCCTRLSALCVSCVLPFVLPQWADIQHLQSLMGWAPSGTSIAVIPLHSTHAHIMHARTHARTHARKHARKHTQHQQLYIPSLSPCT